MTARRVFLITGLPATGKTTLARALAADLAAPLLSKDVIKEPLFDTLGAPDRAASRRLSDASFAVLFALADEYLPLLGTVVMEGNFRPGEHAPVLQSLLVRHAPVACTQVLCRVPEALRQERLAARAADPARHSGHRDGIWVAPAALGDDGFVDIAGPRLVLAGDTIDPAHSCALIHSLTNRQLV
ncbi:MAG TPA: AAA family ATPase [Steroidobacteraceae bacterium]